MFRFFENLLRPTEIPPDKPPPVLGERRGLLRFYWHFAGQLRWLIAALFVAGLFVALLDSMIPVFIGRVVQLVTHGQRETLLADHWRQLVGMAAVLLIARPSALLF